MKADNFLAKLPIMLGMLVSGTTCLILFFQLFSGRFLITPQKTEIFYQQPVNSPVSAIDWEASEKNLCYRSGGRWVVFADGCDNSCERIANPDLGCSQEGVEACDCGDDRCWNREKQTCEPY